MSAAKGNPQLVASVKKYWAQFTPEQRSAMLRKRMKKAVQTRAANKLAKAAKMTPQEAGRKGGLANKGKERGNGLSHADERRIIRNAADRLSTGAHGERPIAEFHVDQSDARVMLAKAQAAALEILNLVASLRTFVE